MRVLRVRSLGVKRVLTLLILVAFLASQRSSGDEGQEVLIGFERPIGLSAQSIVQALEAQLMEPGGRIEYTYRLIDAVLARVSAEALERLRQSPNVRYIVPDGQVATPERWAALQPEVPQIKAATQVELYPWGVERVKAPVVHRASLPSPWALGPALGLSGLAALVAFRRKIRGLLISLLLGLVAFMASCSWALVLPHAGIMGEGVEVALLDTGIDLQHPDLRANILGGIDLVNGDDDPQDDNGHGSGVAGLLAAAENGAGLIGVAPKARLWAIKMLGADEQGSISDLIRGIEWAVEKGVDIISMSLGTLEDNIALHEAIQAAYRAGILLVAAAGNKGERVLFPAAYPEVIAVAATDKNDRRAWFSNMGPEVELSAPGTDLLSTGLKGGYQVFNGTSFAVSHVSGVAALLFSAGLKDPQKVRRILDETAEDLGLIPTAQGYGLVNAERALLGR